MMDIYEALTCTDSWEKRIKVYRGKEIYYIGSTDEMPDNMLYREVEKYAETKYEITIWLKGRYK